MSIFASYLHNNIANPRAAAPTAAPAVAMGWFAAPVRVAEDTTELAAEVALLVTELTRDEAAALALLAAEEAEAEAEEPLAVAAAEEADEIADRAEDEIDAT